VAFCLASLCLGVLAWAISLVGILLGSNAVNVTDVYAVSIPDVWFWSAFKGTLVDVWDFSAFGLVPGFVLGLSFLTFCTRRLHDLNMSGRYSMIFILLGLGGVIAYDRDEQAVSLGCQGALAIAWLALAVVSRISTRTAQSANA